MIRYAPKLVPSLFLLFALLTTRAAHAEEPNCSPKGVDVCQQAEEHAEASKAMPLFNSTEEKLAAGEPAFESPSSSGREYRQHVIMPYASTVRAKINPDQTFAHAAVSAGMHHLGRTAFCRGNGNFVDNGGIIRATYFFQDRVRITEVVITDCSDAAITWDRQTADPCAPYGYDICEHASKFAEAQTKLIEEAKRRAEKRNSHHEMSAFRADGSTLTIDFRDTHTLAEQQNGRPHGAPDTAYLEVTRKLAAHMSCIKPAYDLIHYGGTIVSRFLSADDHLVVEHRISFCESEAGQKTENPR